MVKQDTIDCIVTMRKQYISYSKIANILNLSAETVRKYSELNNLGIDTIKCVAERNIEMCRLKTSDYFERTKDQRAKEYLSRCNTNLEYIDGTYTGSDGTMDVYCPVCNNSFSITVQPVRRGRYEGCPVCIANERARAKAEKKKAEALVKAQEKERLRLIRIAEKEAEAKAKWHTVVCKECGNKFDTNLSRAVYCSDECRRRGANKNKDNRINKTNSVDKDITLPKLYRRDNGICYLCGDVCDWNDYSAKEGRNGRMVKIPGKRYPTVEHIIPLSKGGKDAWSNIKLAHKSCNENKSDISLFCEKTNGQIAILI